VTILQTKYKNINVHGFSFNIESSDYSDQTNAVSLNVTTTSSENNNLSYFILGVPVDNKKKLEVTKILSFDKKRDQKQYEAESMCNILKVDDDDIPLIGLKIEEQIDGAKSLTYQYDLKLSNRLDFFALGMKLDENIYIMEVEKDMENNDMIVTETAPEIIVDETPVVVEEQLKHRPKPKKAICLPTCEDFCLYFIIPEGYTLCNLDDAKISIFKKCLFIEEDTLHESAKVCTPCGNVHTRCRIYRSRLVGSVKINASLPIKNDDACEEYAEVCADESFCLDEVIGYSAKCKTFDLDKISICPDYKSLDVTVLNECSGKTAVRLDGKLIISLKHCD